MLTPRKLRKGDDGIAIKDRISSLHDVVLADILSCLPTKDAVATSVLSKRWRHVFTWVTRLEFDDSPISHCLRCPHVIDYFPVFKMFVDNVLQACQSENITTFRLHFGRGEYKCRAARCNERCFPEMEPMHVNAWISFSLTRGVRELDIWIRVRKPDKLPSALFGWQTLEVLKLDMNLDLEVPLSLCLPNLKEFHLTLPQLPDDNSVTRLVSSCPSLDHLALAGRLKPENPVCISSPTLRRLAMSVAYLRNHQRSKLKLNVPNLESLVYDDTFALHYSIGDPNFQVEAQVGVVFVYRSPDCIENVLNLVSSLSNVQRLFLKHGCVKALDACEFKHKLPVFHNLNHLEFGCFGYIHWHKILMELLSCAPLLETLVFAQGITWHSISKERRNKAFVEEGESRIYSQIRVAVQECQSWSKTQIIPSCVGSHLRRISIKRYHRTKWELEMVKYFLRNSLVLKELMVACQTKASVEDRILLDSTLQKLPRGSMTCSIIVQ